MKFITTQELVQLQQILINNTLLQTADVEFRSALLTNCGLGKYCSLVSLDKPSIQFVISLCAKLSDVCITVDGSERLGLVVFLEYLSQIDFSLSTKEQVFINHVITKCQQSHTPSTGKQQLEQALSPHSQAPITSIQDLAEAKAEQPDSQNTHFDIDALVKQTPILQVSPDQLEIASQALEMVLSVTKEKEARKHELMERSLIKISRQSKEKASSKFQEEEARNLEVIEDLLEFIQANDSERKAFKDKIKFQKMTLESKVELLINEEFTYKALEKKIIFPALELQEKIKLIERDINLR